MKFYNMGERPLEYPVRCGSKIVIPAGATHVKIAFGASPFTYIHPETGKLKITKNVQVNGVPTAGTAAVKVSLKGVPRLFRNGDGRHGAEPRRKGTCRKTKRNSRRHSGIHRSGTTPRADS